MLINNAAVNQVVASRVPSWRSKLFLFSKAAQAAYVNANALATPNASTNLDAVTHKLSTQSLMSQPKDKILFSIILDILTKNIKNHIKFLNINHIKSILNKQNSTHHFSIQRKAFYILILIYE